MMDLRLHMISTHEARLLTRRVTLVMSGLVLWTSLMLVILTYRSVGRSILTLEFVAVLVAVALAVLLARLVTRPRVHAADAAPLPNPGRMS